MSRLHHPSSHAPCLPSPRQAGLLLAAGLVQWLVTGCAWLDVQMHGDEARIHAISLHHFAEPAVDVSGKTVMVTDANGTQQVCVFRVPILASRQIMSGKLEETGDPERPALRLLLDRQGSILWLQACQDTPGDRVAVMLDGFYWYTMELPRPTDTQSILINGPIGRAEAKAIIDAIPAHYRWLNPRPGLL